MAASKTPRRRLTRRTVVLLAVLAAVLGGLLWDGSPLGGFVLRQAIRVKFREVRQVSPAELVTWMRDPHRPPPLLIDARADSSFRLSHIDGAVRLDPEHPDLAPLEHVPRDQPLVVYDAAGVVGTAMVLGLEGAGFSRVSNLEGGLFRWVNEGHPVVDDSGATGKVDPVSWGWGRLLKARYRP
jgi:rhodanese-related sulfurtransferase